MKGRTYFALAALAAALVLSALPALAVDSVIYNGSDFWWTRGDGSTYADFSAEPIPAGFFCSRSEAFTGRIVFQGVPLTTSEGQLGRVDTIIQRLDDAAFDKSGVATTRLQMRALHLESVAPVKTTCGKFNVRVRLEGEQPVTRMRIVRKSEDGGRFVAPVAVNVKISFVPVSGKSRETLEVARNIRFQPSVIPWTFRASTTKAFEKAGFVLVDTDLDGRPDTFVPGTSNFVAGRTSSRDKIQYTGNTISRDGSFDHTDPLHVHTTTPPS